MNYDAYQQLAIALGLGLLVGVQREWSESDVAGVRTFALTTLLGALSALVEPAGSWWLAGAGLLAVAALLVVANSAKVAGGEYTLGLTTEVALLLMFLVGVAVGHGITGPAVVVCGTAAVLLHWKGDIHKLISRIGENDFRAISQLVLIGLVILPVLPDATYGPYDVLNPFKIWLMVVLIVGISLCAYVAQRVLGARVGAILAGLLGGLISSTATTVSYARQASGGRHAAATAALVIMLASTMVNGRVLVEIAIVAPALLRHATVPLVLLTAWMAVLSLLILWRSKDSDQSQSLPDNPAQMKAAIVFGLLYAAILFAVAAAKEHFGNQAIYGIAAISGLTDMDAITLSVAHMYNGDRLDGSTAWRVIVVAMISNLVFKAGAVALLGSRRLLLWIAGAFGLTIVAGVALILFLPG